jgi:hypothetical protein
MLSEEYYSTGRRYVKYQYQISRKGMDVSARAVSSFPEGFRRTRGQNYH